MTDFRLDTVRSVEATHLCLGDSGNDGAERTQRELIRNPENSRDASAEHVIALNRLGALEHASGRYEEAEEHFRAALEKSEEITRPDDPALLPVLSNLVAVRIRRGMHAAAEPLVARIVSITRRTHDEDRPAVTILLNDLARASLDASAYAVAEPLLLQLLEVKLNKGDDHPEVATVLASLAVVRQSQGRHESAEHLCKRVLEIRELTLPPNHVAIAAALEHLAEACAAREKIPEALELFQRAARIRELTLGSEHATLRMSRERIADLQLQAREACSTELYETPSVANEALRLRGDVLQLKFTGSHTREWRDPPSGASDADAGSSEAALESTDVTATPGDTQRAIPLRDLILSIGQELDAEHGRTSLSERARALFAWSLATLQHRSKEALAGLGAVALVVFVQAAESRKSGGEDGTDRGPLTSSYRSAPVNRIPAVYSGSLDLPNTGPLAIRRQTSPSPRTNPEIAEARPPRPISSRGKDAFAAGELNGQRNTPLAIRSLPAPCRARSVKDCVPEDIGSNVDSVARVVASHLRPVGVAVPPSVSFGSSGPLGAALTSSDLPPVSMHPVLIGPAPQVRYPEQLSGVDGYVRVRFSVDTVGRPVASSLTVVSSSSPFFTEAVRKALPGLRFSPGRSGGLDSRAVADSVEMGFRFSKH